jgi:hypothetical protein
MIAVHQKLKTLLKQRPGIEPVPDLLERSGDGKLQAPLLQGIADLAGVPAQDAEP